VAMRAIEILGINQGRQWGAASLNETRKFFKLKPHETFLQMNPDPDVAASLEALYEHPDNVELYPGLVCEDTKPAMAPGSGLCAGLTVAKAILSDAVALVRGDRYVISHRSLPSLTNKTSGSTLSTTAHQTSLHLALLRSPPTPTSALEP
jgi:hypothetical protein